MTHEQYIEHAKHVYNSVLIFVICASILAIWFAIVMDKFEKHELSKKNSS